MEFSPETLSSILDLAASRHSDLKIAPTISQLTDIQNALVTLPGTLPQSGLGTEKALDFVRENVVPGLAGGQAGPRYFGFVTGGVLPAAEAGDFLTTIYDQNCGSNLAEQSVSGAVEDRTLEMILDLFDLPRDKFTARTLTTGATASNVLAMACGRDYAVRTATGKQEHSVAEDGFAGITVQVLCDRPHASTVKAASIVGIGRSNVIDIGSSDGKGVDLGVLEAKLSEYTATFERDRKAAFVVLSFGEVNTGEFSPNVAAVRALSFGAFARIVPELSFMAKNLELADSITSDAHKWFNVPYDCGIFFSPEIEAAHSIPSGIVVGIENSRRFRALPLFCALLAMGKQGYSELISRNVSFARRVAEWMHTGPGSKWYQVLNADTGAVLGQVDLSIILFRAKSNCGVDAYGPKNPTGSSTLVNAINETRRIYVTPSVGSDGLGAIRLAVSNWMTGLGDEFEVVIGVLEEVMVKA
ncbi:pyridoxal phosphate-dependent transferase [Rhizoctonia solani]|nr:pyridoxal phosphate-dependent transferase [Rhizoctonia solani]